MNITVSLTPREAPAGIDQEHLTSDVEAEIKKLAARVETEPTRVDHPAPQDAQGAHQIIEWVVNLATDPTMASAYAQGFLYALNQIVQGYLQKKSGPTESAPKKKAKSSTALAKVTIAGKTIFLPVATVAIREFLKSLK